MMEKQWAAEVAEFKGETLPDEAVFNLMLPRSKCPKCAHQIKWYENIPVLSYLFLRGKCSACKTPISLRYPTIELVTGALFFYCIWRWGLTPTGLAWCGFSATLLSLSMIDWDTTLLPDDMTLPLLWAGLLLAALKLPMFRLNLLFGVQQLVIFHCGLFIGFSSSSRAKKAWVMVISNCSQLWGHGLAGRH